jgi:hypothetical protein
VCGDFAVHAQTTVTFAGIPSTINGGNVGVFPGTSITGAHVVSLNQQAGGSSELFAASVVAAHADAIAVHANETPMAIEIGGLTFTPGMYRSGSAINFAYGTVVTLDGLNEPNPEFLFIAGSTLVTAADTSFSLINGAKAENVLWALGSAATLGANSHLQGSILAGTAITFGTQSELHGCALAQSAVTFESEGSVVLNHYIADGPGNARRLRRWIDPSRHATQPHIKHWKRKSFDFHGECDLVLLHSDHVNGNKVLDLHIRTTIADFFSSIEVAVLRVGEVLLEMDAKTFSLDGVNLEDGDLPFDTSEFTISEPVYTPGFKVRREYNIVLNDKSVINVRKNKSFLSISVVGGHEDFDHSYGLLGDFYTGDSLGRDGRTIEDWTEYGMEWQVQPDEPMLFKSPREPQLPSEKCRMPGVAKPNRRLRALQNRDLVDKAMAACARAGDEFDACMSDVMLTGDLSFAEAW